MATAVTRRVDKKTMARIAAKGRWHDTELAHLTKGEVVLPGEVAKKLQGQLTTIMGRTALAQNTVGSEDSWINPYTGLEEFGWGSFKKRFKRIIKKSKKIVKKAVKPIEKAVKKVVPREFRHLFPKEVRRINELEKKVKGAIPNELKKLYQKVNSFEDLKKLPGKFEDSFSSFRKKVMDDIIPRELTEVYQKLNSLEDFKRTVIPNEFTEIYKKLNSFEDIKYQFGSKLQKVIDVIPGLGGGGLLASRRDVRKADEAAARAAEAARKAQQSEWERQMADLTGAYGAANAELKADMQSMMDAQAERWRIQAKETEGKMTASRIAGIRQRRAMGEGSMTSALALSNVGGESGKLGSSAMTSARITGRRSRGVRATGAAIPNIYGRPA